MTIEVHHHKKSDISSNGAKAQAHITASDAACAYFNRQLAKKTHAQSMRLSVETTGCSGFQYVLNYVETINPDDLFCSLQAELHLYVDPKCLDQVKGTHLDYAKEGIIERILFNNPNEKGSCGCGESFTV